MDKTWKPITAGAIDIISSILGCLGIMLMIVLTFPLSRGSIGTLILFYCFLFIIPLPAVCLSFAGGVYAIRRKRWRLALAGAASAFLSLAVTCFSVTFVNPDTLLGSPLEVARNLIILTFTIPMLVGWVPIILTTLSKKEFK